MSEEITTSAELNPYYAKVIGFVDQSGSLIENSAGLTDYFRLLINVGDADDVKIGERVLVFSLGQQMNDPETNESLGHFEVVRGYGRVTSVQTRMSVIDSSKTKTVQYQKPQNINSVIMGTQIEYGQREDPAPFTKPQIGDLIRFV